jgi:hypothetical protein
LQRELLDLKERHKIELESVKADCELRVESHTARLEDEYAARAS